MASKFTSKYIRSRIKVYPKLGGTLIFLSLPLSNSSTLIRTKAIFEPANNEDGLRFLIIRLPLNVGRNHYFQWLPEVAPSVRLLKQWKGRKITWKTFFQKYTQEMQTTPEAQKIIAQFRELIKKGQQITLLCFESEWRRDCHRHILKEIILQTETESKPDSHYNMSSAKLLSYVPRLNNKERQAVLELELEKITNELPKLCYYCNSDKFTNKDQYQKHILVKHAGKLSYPGLAEIKISKLIPQAMPWEI